MRKTNDKLTAHERNAIDAIRYLATRGGYVTTTQVARRTGQSQQGAAIVLSYCVQKGLATRAASTTLMFKLTARGWDLATPRTQQARRQS